MGNIDATIKLMEQHMVHTETGRRLLFLVNKAADGLVGAFAVMAPAQLAVNAIHTTKKKATAMTAAIQVQSLFEKLSYSLLTRSSIGFLCALCTTVSYRSITKICIVVLGRWLLLG